MNSVSGNFYDAFSLDCLLWVVFSLGASDRRTGRQEMAAAAPVVSFSQCVCVPALTDNIHKWSELEFVNLLGAQESIPYSMHRPARPRWRNRFLGFLNVYKYGLWSITFVYKYPLRKIIIFVQVLFSTNWSCVIIVHIRSLSPMLTCDNLIPVVSYFLTVTDRS